MPRLKHSHSAFLRSMQISGTKLFVFVEGVQSDSYFYSRVCSAAVDGQINYEIASAQQISGVAGGKSVLIAFFTFLRIKKALVSDLAGKRTACIFFLDKDIDDLKRIKKRSPHVVYTQCYDVENYIFQHGNLVQASAAAASVDPSKFIVELGNASQWCCRIATYGQDWVGLCLRMIKDGINCEATYRVLSPIQTRPCGPMDSNTLNSLISIISTQAHIPVNDLKRKHSESTKKVGQYFAKGEHHRIFKGKWFSHILADDIDRIMAGIPYDKNGLARRLSGTIAVTLDFSESWADYLRQSVCKIVAML